MRHAHGDFISAPYETRDRSANLPILWSRLREQKSMDVLFLLRKRSGSTHLKDNSNVRHGVLDGALAEMAGTTTSRNNVFMNKFRRSGFLNYGKDGIQVHSSLLSMVLKD